MDKTDLEVIEVEDNEVRDGDTKMTPTSTPSTAATVAEKLIAKARVGKKGNPTAKRLFKALNSEKGGDYKIVMRVIEGRESDNVDSLYADAIEILED